MTGAPPPLISLLLDLDDCDGKGVDQTISSLTAQVDPGWEVVIHGSDDATAHYAQSGMGDPRIRVISTHGSVAQRAQTALESVTGDYLGLLEAGGRIEPKAVQSLRTLVDGRPDVDVIYTDEALVDPASGDIEVLFKPAWSPERLRGHLYTGRLLALRTSLAREVGGFRDGFAGAHEHDLVLRVTEQAQGVERLGEVLHRRVGAGGLASEQEWDGHVDAVQAHLDRSGLSARAVRGPVPGTCRIVRVLDRPTSVSVVIPTSAARGLAWGEQRRYVVAAVRSLLQRAGQPVEVVVVHTSDTPRRVLDELQDAAGAALLPLPYAGAFSFPAMCNRGVTSSHGDALVLLDERTEIASDDFVSQLVAPLLEDGVGLTGPRVTAAGGALLGGGLALYSGRSEPMFPGRAESDPGPGLALAVNRECSGITPTCLAITRDTYLALGGFNEQLVSSCEVDLSYKVARAGLRRVWLAHTVLRHFPPEVDRRVEKRERELLGFRWASPDLDPYVPSFGQWRLQRARREEAALLD